MKPLALFQLVMAALLSLALGCKGGGGGGLQLEHANSAQDKPNNVWVFFQVKNGDEPVGGLTKDDFVIYEDGNEVSKYESKQEILNPEVAAVMYTMLLVDMSGSIVEANEAENLVDAAKAFSEKVGKKQKVGVYAFDGEEKIHSVVPFTEAQGSVEGGLEGLKSYKPKDPSTNLNGAVIEGLRELRKELDKDKRPLKFGTLVVFSDGADQAHRKTPGEMTEEMDKKDYETFEIYAIGVGAELEQGEGGLHDIGRDGVEMASDKAKVKEAFDKVAQHVEDATKSYYLLSYCTPSRKGEHEVSIEAHVKRDESDSSGSIDYTFNADGFGPPPDCDPKKKPTFDLKQIKKEGDDDDDDDDDGNASAKGNVDVKASGKAK